MPGYLTILRPLSKAPSTTGKLGKAKNKRTEIRK